MPEEKVARPEAKSIEVTSEDLMVMCGCRKVSMVVKGGKRRLDALDAVTNAVRDACAAVCECKGMLANVARKPHD
jgi:hypothetical protein